MLSWNKDVRVQSVKKLRESAAKGHVEAKKELSRRLMEGELSHKDEAKAVSLLEDCVAHGDADAMMMLAKCCALGRGIEHNGERAEALMSDAAMKGNDEARILMKIINDWKGEESIDLEGLQQYYFETHREN